MMQEQYLYEARQLEKLSVHHQQIEQEQFSFTISDVPFKLYLSHLKNNIRELK